jgi:hypothetical protein
MRRPGARFVAASLLALLPLFASAQAVPPEDASEIRAVIEAQLDAFRRDDAARAYSYAAPAIREMYGSPAEFIEMVRSFYAAVYRPRSVAFDPPVRQGAQLVQPVRLTDAEGRAWIAYYPMLRDAAGQWRINGCQLARVAGQAV